MQSVQITCKKFLKSILYIPDGMDILIQSAGSDAVLWNMPLCILVQSQMFQKNMLSPSTSSLLPWEWRQQVPLQVKHWHLSNYMASHSRTHNLNTCVRTSNPSCLLFSMAATKFKSFLVPPQKLTCYSNTTSWEDFKSCFGLSQFVCHTRVKFWLVTRKKVSTICLKIH